MTLHLIDAEAPAKIAANRDRLRAGSWGGTETVCLMSALVAGAGSVVDCVTAGWPEWLAELNVNLFDATVGAADERVARLQFAMDIAVAVSVPRDYAKALDWFLIRRLDDGDHSALKTLRSLPGDWSEQIAAVEAVAALLRRRVAGENVADALRVAADAADAAARAARAAARAARAAARFAAYAAADAARSAAYAAARAAARAARAARAAADAADAAYAADAAADAARAAADAYAAAHAAARADLLIALSAA